MLTDISAFGGNILGKFTQFSNRALKRVSQRGNSIHFFALEAKKKPPKTQQKKPPKLVLADYSEMKENSCLLQLPTPREGGLKGPLKLHVELGFMELSQALCSCQQPGMGILAPRCRRQSMRLGFLGTEAGDF